MMCRNHPHQNPRYQDPDPGHPEMKDVLENEMVESIFDCQAFHRYRQKHFAVC